MRLWLDDLREPWKHGFILCEWAHTAEQAIEQLKTGEVTFASLDHDLKPEHYQANTGYGDNYHCGVDCGCVVVDWMEENNVWPVDGVRVHSQNESAAIKMRLAVDKHYGDGYSRTEALKAVAEFIDNVKAGKYDNP